MCIPASLGMSVSEKSISSCQISSSPSFIENKKAVNARKGDAEGKHSIVYFAKIGYAYKYLGSKLYFNASIKSRFMHHVLKAFNCI